MVARFVSSVTRPRGGNYFPHANQKLRFISTGCTLLDCVLGGGWPLGRVVNIVGDKSVGKTLLAIEAAANFARQYEGIAYYREVEAAFDEGYAAELGMPLDRVDFGPSGIDTVWDTIEAVIADLEKCCRKAIKAGTPGLYVIDSLDALSSEAELERAADAKGYNLEKQKRLGELFRRQVRLVRQAEMCLVFVSQIRDRIGVFFGRNYTRTGGKALDFYASIILYLSHMKTLTKTISGVKRATAVRIKARCEKNKVTSRSQEIEFNLRFGYGVDDLEACLEWLEGVGRLGDLTGKSREGFLKESERLNDAAYVERLGQVRDRTTAVWQDIGARFKPTRKKYNGVDAS